MLVWRVDLRRLFYYAVGIFRQTNMLIPLIVNSLIAILRSRYCWNVVAISREAAEVGVEVEVDVASRGT